MGSWEYLNTTWELDYSTTQINLGIGNEWTYDWGGNLAIDFYQSGVRLSDKITVTQKDGAEDTASKKSAEEQSSDMSTFTGALIFTFGFGF